MAAGERHDQPRDLEPETGQRHDADDDACCGRRGADTKNTAGAALEGGTLHRLSPAGREQLAQALQPAFLLAVILCALVFLVSLLWVREAPLRRDLDETPPGVGDEASPQPAGVVNRPE